MPMHGLLPLLLWWCACLSLTATTTTADDLGYLIFSDSDCPTSNTAADNDNTTRGGGTETAFEANLEATLSSLPAAAASVASAGYATATTGVAPDRAYGLAQCRGDVGAADCRSCLDDTAREMGSACRRRSAMVVREGCMLRYSDANVFGSATDWSYPIFNISNQQEATRPPELVARLGALMGKLSWKAAYEFPTMFAAGRAEYTGFASLYGMARCTRGIPAADCSLCLAKAVGVIPHCCDGKEGGRVFFLTCAVRFEIYPFYDEQGPEAAMSLARSSGTGSG